MGLISKYYELGKEAGIKEAVSPGWIYAKLKNIYPNVKIPQLKEILSKYPTKLNKTNFALKKLQIRQRPTGRYKPLSKTENTVKKLRRQLGLSQSNLAKKLNVSTRAIQTWERRGSVPLKEKYTQAINKLILNKKSIK